VTQFRLPDLPVAVANASAAWLFGWVYVAGGESREGAQGTFWRLNLAQATSRSDHGQWQTLRGWPGAPRFGGILMPVTTPRGAGILWCGGMQGPARSQADYLRDAFVYVVARDTWGPVAAMPRGAVLAAAVSVDDARVLVLGGSDGHDFEKMKELGERYRIPTDLLLYDAAEDRWSAAGTMPLGVVGAAIVRVDEGWLVAGGEFSPGLRTPQVFRVNLNDRQGNLR
jgi:N-acetylneuraminic acid mutarotase